MRNFSETRGSPRWSIYLLLGNGALLVGSCITLILIVVTLAAPLLSQHDPNAPVLRYAEGRLLPPPYPPGTPDLPLGSDLLWRDMWSRLVYGSRYTLACCTGVALVRVVIGGALAVLATWAPLSGRFVDVLVGTSSALPSLFFALLPIYLVNNVSPEPIRILTFVIVLSLTGWAEITVQMRISLQAVRQQLFVKAAYALGIPPSRIVWRHIFPNVWDLILVQLTASVAATLVLVAELALLGVFIGGAEPDIVNGKAVMNPIYPEWGSMLAVGLRQSTGGLWLLLEPVFAFTITIIGVSMLAEGLRQYYRR